MYMLATFIINLSELPKKLHKPKKKKRSKFTFLGDHLFMRLKTKKMNIAQKSAFDFKLHSNFLFDLLL